MKASIKKSNWQSLALGVIAGMRAASAPAIASHMLSGNKSKHLLDSRMSFMQSERWATGLKFLAAGELVADKLPFAPARIEPLGVGGRVLSGGLTGAAVSKANNDNIVTGAALGVAAALASTFAFYFLRREVGKRFDVYDPVLGAVEDALVFAGGIALTKTA